MKLKMVFYYLLLVLSCSFVIFYIINNPTSRYLVLIIVFIMFVNFGWFIGLLFMMMNERNLGNYYDGTEKEFILEYVHYDRMDELKKIMNGVN